MGILIVRTGECVCEECETYAKCMRNVCEAKKIIILLASLVCLEHSLGFQVLPIFCMRNMRSVFLAFMQAPLPTLFRFASSHTFSISCHWCSFVIWSVFVGACMRRF